MYLVHKGDNTSQYEIINESTPDKKAVSSGEKMA